MFLCYPYEMLCMYAKHNDRLLIIAISVSRLTGKEVGVCVHHICSILAIKAIGV